MAPKFQGCGTRCCPHPSLGTGEARTSFFLTPPSSGWGPAAAGVCALGSGSEATICPCRCKDAERAAFSEHLPGTAGGVSKRGGAFLLKSVLEALLGQMLACRSRQGDAWLPEKRESAPFIEQEQCHLGEA